MTKKRATFVAVSICALALGALALNAGANASARDELEGACGCARGSVELTLRESSSVFFEMFGDDAGEMRSYMRSEVYALCDELDAELTPLTWNVGRNFSVSPQPRRRARATAAIDRARPRCPAIYREALGGSTADHELAERLCDELFDGMARADQAEPESIPIWEWPTAIDSSMCLEAVRARESSTEAP